MSDLVEGNREALATLFVRHHQNVYRLCSRFCQSDAAAEDVTQEVFLRVLRHAATFSASAQFKTWLFRVARNACLDHMRSSKRELRKREQLASEPVVTDSDSQINSDDLARLHEAMQRLQPETREVLVLRRYHQLAYAEIAEICGCSVGAVRVRLHRALQALRKHYMLIGSQPAKQHVVEGET